MTHFTQKGSSQTWRVSPTYEDATVVRGNSFNPVLLYTEEQYLLWSYHFYFAAFSYLAYGHMGWNFTLER